MKKYFSIFLFIFSLLNNYSFAQRDPIKRDTTKIISDHSFNFGIGLGTDYGGLGTRFTIVPLKHVAPFLGLGYNLVGLGANVGAGYLLNPDKRTCVYFIGMYGYNAVIKIVDASKYDKIYYGMSVGIGIQLWNRAQNNFWNLELLLPFRPRQYEDDLNAIKKNPQLRIDIEPPPVSFSIGYHFD